MKRKILVGVAWPYVNGELHVGHLAGYLLPADIFARYARLNGDDVLMVSGSDCFGTPITVEADKRGITPDKIVDEYHRKDLKLFFDILNLSYDLYTKTDHPNHVEITQEFFLQMLSKGYIFKGTTKQYYSESDKRFLPDRYVEGKCSKCGFEPARSDQCDNCGSVLSEGELKKPVSKLTGNKVTLKETEHYFIDWPKIQPKLLKYVDKASGNWKDWVKSETYGWLNQGLKPRAISRDLDWGVPIPVEKMKKEDVIDNFEHKRLYVWFDAVIGYYSASVLWAKENNKDWKEFWYGDNLKHYYFMGKDNLIFHTLFWPGQLMGMDEKLHLPDVVSINMFLNLEGRQFSKSRGVSIPIEEIVKSYSNDPVRFYLTYIMPELKDSSFSWTDFMDKNNDILVANLGNFIHRTLSIAKDDDLNSLKGIKSEKQIEKKVLNTFEKSRKYLENCEFKNYLESILELSSFGNKYLNENKLWELKKTDKSRYLEVLKQLFLLIATIAHLIKPLLPETAKKIMLLAGIQDYSMWPTQDDILIKVNQSLNNIQIDQNIKPLFNKIEIEKKEASS